MELIYTDSDKNDVGVLTGAKADMAYGDDENRFTVELSADSVPPGLERGSLVYAEGTEWGGRVTRIRTVTSDGAAVFGGRTWHGMLADHVVVPPDGEDFFQVSGEGNSCIRALVDHCGMSGTFAVSYEDSGIYVPSHSFERFCDAYTGLRKMLAAGGAKLKVRSEAPKPVLYAEPVVDWSAVDDIDATQVDIDAQVDYCPVNHLVCAGTGEGRNRVVVHLYADSNGEVSRTQTIFGDDEVAELYDYPNAGEAELVEKGTERLKGYQNPRSGDLVLVDSVDYDVGDIVGRSDPYTGVEVVSSVSKAILRISDSESITYELGEMQASQARGTVAESSGGVSYVAGDGIMISGRTISAEVTPAMHEAVAATAKEALSTASGASAAAGGAQQAADAAQGTADGALAAAGAARAAADAAQASADGNVATVAASSPLTASRSGQAVSLSHAASGVTAGAYGPSSNAAPGFGDTVTVGARTSVNATGHVTGMSGRTVTIPDDVATQSADGLMAASDKAKLDGVAAGANKYVHPTGAGHNHVPAGGSSGQVLRWSASGTAAWGADKDTTYSPATESAAGLMSAADKAKVDAYPWADITGKPATYPPAPHTHLYAGSSKAGGAATSAVKLTTARKIAIAGAVNGSASFDGSGDVTITVTGDSEAAGFLAAHPIGAYFETEDGGDPAVAYGGTWEQVPSLGAYKWKRIC